MELSICQRDFLGAVNCVAADFVGVVDRAGSSVGEGMVLTLSRMKQARQSRGKREEQEYE